MDNTAYGAWAFLEGYATEAFDLAENYISELNNYIVGTINTTPPAITIPGPGSIIIDPNLISIIPGAPLDSAYPPVPSSPSTTDYPFPTPPVYTLPPVPVMTDIVLPTFIESAIEGPTTLIPVLDFDVPSIAQLQDGGLSPEDALVQAARAKLIKNIISGGTMLNPEVEADIWNRDLERAQQALQDQIDKVTAQWAKMGWSLPDGLLSGQLISLNNEYMNKRLDTSRDISVEQAKLEQQGMFESLKIAVQLEQVLFGNLNDYARRVFETSKSTADITIELFKERVVRYNALLETFKADIDGYKANIEAELERAEVYKAQLSGLQIIAGIDDTRVKSYATQIGALGQLVDLYKTNIQAVATMYDAEKTKIEMFKTQVEAYTSQVDAITKKYAVKIEGFKAYIQAYVASADSQTKLDDIAVQAEIAQVEATIKVWETQAKLIEDNLTLKMEALKAVAQTASNLAAGALSGIHAQVSDSFQSSVQQYYDLTPNA
jgi:hypothetical protein